MIIKSLSRKGSSKAFRQLYDYIVARAEPNFLEHNLYCHSRQRAKVIREFEENARHIKQTSRHNVCYHEVLSLKRHPERGEDFQARQIEALRHVTQEYLNARAPGQLAFGAIHLDQAESIHAHLMISSNERDSSRRVRLAKQDFLQIQRDLEQHLQERFPELGERTVYNNPREQSQNLSDREQAMKKRTKQPSKKDQLRATVESVFKESRNQAEAQQRLADLGIELVHRGKNVTVSHDGLKCRLKTLGIEGLYQNLDRERGFER